jgi:hypothetical protein
MFDAILIPRRARHLEEKAGRPDPAEASRRRLERSMEELRGELSRHQEELVALRSATAEVVTAALVSLEGARAEMAEWRRAGEERAESFQTALDSLAEAHRTAMDTLRADIERLEKAVAEGPRADQLDAHAVRIEEMAARLAALDEMGARIETLERLPAPPPGESPAAPERAVARAPKDPDVPGLPAEILELATLDETNEGAIKDPVTGEVEAIRADDRESLTYLDRRFRWLPRSRKDSRPATEASEDVASPTPGEEDAAEIPDEAEVAEEDRQDAADEREPAEAQARI